MPFLRSLLELPELALVDESCADERRLHEALVERDRGGGRPERLAALADADARCELRDLPRASAMPCCAAGTLEAYYLALLRGGPHRHAAGVRRRVVAAIVEHLLGPAIATRSSAAPRSCCTVRSGSRIARRPRPPRRRVDADRAGAAPASTSSAVCCADTATTSPTCRYSAPPTRNAFDRRRRPARLRPRPDPRGRVNDLGHGLRFTMARADSGLKALARVLERWVAHFLGVRTTIRPLQRIDDPRLGLAHRPRRRGERACSTISIAATRPSRSGCSG